MSNIWLLTKTIIKNGIFNFNGKSKKSKSSKKSSLSMIILFVFLFALMCVPISLGVNEILHTIDISSLLIKSMMAITGLMCIVYGAFSVISVFYLNKDSEQYLHLPIKSGELLIAKFLASLMSVYLINALLILPVFIGVGIGVGASVLFYIYLLLVFILSPIIPTSIATLIILIANKIFDFAKRKNLFTYIMMGFIFVISFAYSFGIEYIMNTGTSGNITQLLEIEGTVTRYSNILFPFFISASDSLLKYNEFIGFASFMTFIFMNIIALLVVYFLGEKLYIKGITTTSGNSKRKSKSNKKESYPCLTLMLIKKEWNKIRRSPVIMLNTIISSLIFPIIFLVSMIATSNSDGDISILLTLIDFNSGGVFLIAAGIFMLFVTSFSTYASCAISIEGRDALTLKTIPISYKKQIDAKVFFASIIDFIVLVLVNIALLVSFRLPIMFMVMLNLVTLVVIFLSNYLSIMLDLARPKLDWKEEQEAVKTNFNVPIMMFGYMLACGLIVFLGWYLLRYSLNIYLVFTVLFSVLLLCLIFINIFISKKGVKMFKKVV